MTSVAPWHFHHQHQVDVLTEYVYGVTAPRGTPHFVSLPVGTGPKRSLSFNRLNLFFNMALTSILSDDWHELNFEIIALMFSVGRFLELSPGLIVSSSSRKGGRKAGVSSADYLRSGFSGRLGAALAAIHARDMGAMYIAHVEDVDTPTVARLHRVYKRPVPGKSKAAAGRTQYSRRKGDFLTVNLRDQIGMLEAKATASTASSLNFLNGTVAEGAEWQVEPFIGGTLTPVSLKSSAAPNAVIQLGLVSGLNINESISGAAIHAISLKIPAGTIISNGLSANIIASIHFQAWWHLFKATFYEFNLPSESFDMPVITFKGMSFVMASHRWRNRFSFFKSSSTVRWTGSLLQLYPFDDQSIFIGIEKNIFMHLLASFERRRVVDEVDLVENIEPNALHNAVLAFQGRLRELEVDAEEDNEEGVGEMQAFQQALRNSISTNQRGNEVASTVFREGVIAFTGPVFMNIGYEILTVQEGS